MKMLEADYAGYDSWALSLRQFLMADLSNLGLNQRKQDQTEKAKKSYEMALRLGKDRPVNYAAENYSVLLSPPFDLKPTAELQGQLACNSARSCADLAYQLNPKNPLAVYNYAFETQKENLIKGGELYLRAIELDPRYEDAYKEIVWLLNTLSKKKGEKAFGIYWAQFKNRLGEILSKRGKNGKSLFAEILKEILMSIPSDPELKKRGVDPQLLKKVGHLAKELGIDKED